MTRPRTPWIISESEAVSRYQSGESLATVARACGLSSVDPLRTRLRERGVPLRPRGSKPGVPRVAREIRSCAGGCGATFEVYRSQNKRYCSPECRYADPAYLSLIRSNLARHTLAEIDEEARTALCAACGHVSIRERVDRSTSRRRWRCRTAERNRSRASKYGVSPEWIEERLRAQGGLCAIGREPLGESMCVDHDHETGVARGLLCDACNRGIGALDDDLEKLRSAVRYLEAAR